MERVKSEKEREKVEESTMKEEKVGGGGIERVGGNEREMYFF